jgi:hypothetical protein
VLDSRDLELRHGLLLDSDGSVKNGKASSSWAQDYLNLVQGERIRTRKLQQPMNSAGIHWTDYTGKKSFREEIERYNSGSKLVEHMALRVANQCLSYRGCHFFRGTMGRKEDS